MSAFATLTLKNSANVDVSFVPSAIDQNGVANWMTSAASFDAKQKASLAVKLPKNGSSVVRVSGRIMQPVMDAVDTTKRVAEGVANFELILPKQMTETDRLDLRKKLETLLTNAVSTAAVQNFESIY